jgi:hypothetical protein
MLSHAVMSVGQVFSSFVILSLTCVVVRDGLSSVEMWFNCGEDWCYDLSNVRMVETVGFYQVMWLVMLESAKNRILWVDTPGQHVPPCVWYGMTCLLIRYVIDYMSFLVEWGWHHTLWSVFVTYFVNCLNHMVQKETFVWKTLALQAGTVCSGNHSKTWHTSLVDLCNSM